MKYIILVLATILLAGCNTTKIGAPKTSVIQSGVSTSALQQAIKKAIYNSKGWVVEKSDLNETVAGVNTRNYYLQITYQYGNGAISSKITGSSSLRQSEKRIHEKALVWKKRLDEKVWREIGMLDPDMKPITLN